MDAGECLIEKLTFAACVPLQNSEHSDQVLALGHESHCDTNSRHAV